jgi:hypothetical protein
LWNVFIAISHQIRIGRLAALRAANDGGSALFASRHFAQASSEVRPSSCIFAMSSRKLKSPRMGSLIAAPTRSTPSGTDTRCGEPSMQTPRGTPGDFSLISVAFASIKASSSALNASMRSASGFSGYGFCFSILFSFDLWSFLR